MQLNQNLTHKHTLKIYLLPRHVALDVNLRIFQYKLLNKVLYLNNVFLGLRKLISSLCSYSDEQRETPLHLFQSCLKAKTYGTNSDNTFHNL